MRVLTDKTFLSRVKLLIFVFAFGFFGIQVFRSQYPDFPHPKCQTQDFPAIKSFAEVKRNELILETHWDSTGSIQTYGFKNSSGQWVIQPKFNYAREFSQGFAPVVISGDWTSGKEKWAFIDIKGRIQFNLSFDEAHSFSDGLASVYINHKYGFINRSGKIVIQPKFSQSWDEFQNGYTPVEIGDYPNGKWGLIDQKGQFVIKPEFDFIERAFNGFYKLKIGDKSGFADSSGHIISRVDSVWKGDFSEGLVSISYDDGNTWGYRNEQGKIVIQPQFMNADVFIESKASVMIDGIINSEGSSGTFALIDTSGHEICRYREYNND
jgi:WG containing repeat